ncbi:type IX secretion system membrane protein PorP/SprF [Aquimarina sp. RZ0]|uniref:PorP/SprF family type IX secretion system membrane protein n=1 Tax=Aquimarina sp. RZ0 TaxID=2607730 RepID=UPI0011F266DE|nr:type IX secretion system membrane protein PorP/SprF [Aquimarina sp. RZ0]KAA1242633.1 type IX secretion system membrane protein PorP/SprF [Aquimarina sp. RZ0]
MKLQKIFLITLMVLSVKFSIAQEGLSIYSDYLTDNYYLLHPSMAGASNCSQVRITGRRNWVGEEDSPGLFTAAYNGRIGENSGIGAIVYNDKNGFSSQTGGYVTYAHHLMFSRSEADLNQLSFGLSAGIIQYRLDQSRFVTNDPLVTSSSVSSSEFNVDVGLSYNLYNFYTHITAKNLLKNSGVNNDLQVTNNLRNYLVSLGYVFARPGKTISYEPSILFSYREGVEQSNVDFNIKVYSDINFGKIWGGLSYRTSLDAIDVVQDNEVQSQNLNYITPFVGANFGKYMVAYTYSYQSNPITFQNGGFHQITLGIDFSCRAKKYACYCPWVE